MTTPLFSSDDLRSEYCANQSRALRQVLNACRDERRPYLIITDSVDDTKRQHWEQGDIRRILVPVSMLEEETYKGELCTYLARKTGAHLILLQAHDVGSRAKQNVQRIITHIQAVSERTGCHISYEVQIAKKDSFSLMREAAERQRDFCHDVLILTASREYGLDDWLFGPQELHAIRHALTPVLLVNPREDLFSLCD